LSETVSTPLTGNLHARIATLATRFDLTPAFLQRYLASRPHIREPVEAAQSEAELFERLGPLYAMYVRFALTTTERGRAFAEFTEPYRSQPRRFLDVGCAYGGFLRALRARGADVVGIELDPELAALGRANLDGGAGEVLHTDILACDVERLGQFDLVACNDVIEHVADARALVHRVAKLLAPGGVAYFEIPNPDALSFVARDGHFQRFGITLLERPLAARYLKEAAGRSYDQVGELHDEATYRRWFADAGLTVVDVPQPHAQRFEDVHDRVFDAVNAFTWWYGHEREPLSVDVAEAIADRYWAYTAELFPALARARKGIDRPAFERRYLAPFWTFVLRR
jgi:2-polyprenyl-3-methyl-5-hydroxy-6-metoxy-1,4-benzoquinol methylase